MNQRKIKDKSKRNQKYKSNREIKIEIKDKSKINHRELKDNSKRNQR